MERMYVGVGKVDWFLSLFFNSNLENSILLEYKGKTLRILFHVLVGLSPYFSILLGKYGKQYIKKNNNLSCGNPKFASVVKEFPLRQEWYNESKVNNE